MGAKLQTGMGERIDESIKIRELEKKRKRMFFSYY